MYGHRSLVVPSSTGRAPEYLENLKNEVESMTHDMNMYKMQRDDFERKLNAQLSEFANFQQTLYDLENSYQRIKIQYEEEILRLRRQLDNAAPSISPQRDHASPPTLHSSSPVPGSSSNTTTSTSQATTQSTLGGAGLLPEKNILAPPEKPRGSGAFAVTRVNNLLSSVLGSSSAGSAPPSITPAKRPRSEELNPPIYVPQQSTLPEQGQPKAKIERREEVALPFVEPAPRVNTTVISSEPNRTLQGEETTEGERKDKGSDWIVGYNHGIETNLNIDLMHNFSHSSVVCCVNFSADGKYLATGCTKSAQIYDVESGRKVHTFIDDMAKGGEYNIRSVCFSPDGQRLATGAEDKTVKIWDITHKKVLQTFEHELDIYSIEYTHDGRYIVSGSGDKKAKIWDIEKGRCVFTLGNEEVGPKDGVTSVAVSPDGRLIAAGSLDRIVRLWDAQTGYFLERYEGHTDSVYSVAFAPDGKSLVSGSLDKTLKLWDLSGSRTRSRCRNTFNGHKDFVLSVAFSPDGNWLVSGSKDRSVQFWDPRAGVPHVMLQGHKNSVISVAISPTSGVFATGSGDYRARLWKYNS